MILDINNQNDFAKINRLQKTRGICLIKKYLPNIFAHEKIIIINYDEEWEKIKDDFPEMITVRTDTIAGTRIPAIGGTTCLKENVPTYFAKAREKVENPYFICTKLTDGAGERIHTQGGFVVDVEIDGNVRIGYTGPSFDCRELTKGKAEHESWVIPWEEIPFVKESQFSKYRVNIIDNDAYPDTAIERMAFLISEYPDKKDEIIETMPKHYKPINPELIRKVYNEVVLKLWMQKQEMKKDGLNKCGVEINVVEDGRLIPFELYRPERFRVYSKEENEKSQERE